MKMTKMKGKAAVGQRVVGTTGSYDGVYGRVVGTMDDGRTPVVKFDDGREDAFGFGYGVRKVK